jgi:hypothetical protein
MHVGLQHQRISNAIPTFFKRDSNTGLLLSYSAMRCQEEQNEIRQSIGVPAERTFCQATASGSMPGIGQLRSMKNPST